MAAWGTATTPDKGDCYMTTVLVQPHEEDITMARELWIPMFVHGECFAFAKALHRGLGWPIMGILRDGAVVHAVVRRPDGDFQDARGVVSEAELGAPFDMMPPYDLRPFREDELCISSQKHERTIQIAAGVAAMFWPDLPWKPESRLPQMIQFVNELETLCSKHKFWLRSTSPTHPIIVDTAVGSEKGYTLEPLLIGFGYALNRRLG